jgi:hypothetical protein
MEGVQIREVEATLSLYRRFNPTQTYSPDQILFINISGLTIFKVIPYILHENGFNSSSN